MSDAPTISAIIPAYNAESTIARAIESALSQTRPPVDIIVTDDGSADGTAAVVAGYAPHVTLIRQENRGPAAARNAAARVAKGEWLALLDADDEWLPEKLERQAPLTRDPAVAIVRSVPITWDRDPAPNPITFDALWQRNWIGASGSLIRRSAFEHAGAFDESRALIGVEDYNLWLRLVHAGWRVSTCPGSLWEYSPGTTGLSRQARRFVLAELANVVALEATLQLQPRAVAPKRAAICEQYARDLLWQRDVVPARRLAWLALRRGATVRRLALLAATLSPVGLLDLQRGWRVAAGAGAPA